MLWCVAGWAGNGLPVRAAVRVLSATRRAGYRTYAGGCGSIGGSCPASQGCHYGTVTMMAIGPDRYRQTTDSMDKGMLIRGFDVP